MTNYEHGQVSKLAGILLLGFLLPQSTGNEFFSLQHRSTQPKQQHQSSGLQTSESSCTNNSDSEQKFLNMSLEERLENSPHRYGNDFGEIDDLVVHHKVETSFRLFLHKGLRPFLMGRPAHATEMDLLHILAMAIHPHPSIPNRQEGGIFWENTKQLMSSLVPQSFCIQYRHRVDLVKLVAECLVLPKALSAPLFDGAVPHLKASLYAFGMAAMTPYDAHLAQCGMVSLAASKDEWSRLLHRMVDDRANYSSEKFSPHAARGDLLTDFLIRYSEARRFAPESFLQYALGSLTDAIEMQVDCWTKEEKEERTTTTTHQPPLVLASLLRAAKHLFYFLLPCKTNVPQEGDKPEESEESDRRDMLISCGIQLIHHWDPTIVKESCTMLVLAFSYTDDILEDYISAVFDSVVIAIDIALKGETTGSVVPIEGLISAFSQRSLSFAVNLFRFLLKTESTSVVIFPLLAAIAHARPAVAQENRDLFLHQLKDIQDQKIRKHLLAILLCCRKTHYFATGNDSSANLLPLISDACLGNWDKYLLSRHAMLTGNFEVAKALYNELAETGSSSERSFLWLSAMKMVADGEARLCEHAAMALPDSVSRIRIAISTLRSLKALKLASTSFQIRLLELRISFLDILTSLRQLTMEMRLIGIEPKKFTRPNLHLKNIVKLLHRLSFDYLAFCKQYGLFICQQSRSSLRTLHALCFFVAKAAGRIFLDSIAIDKGDESINTAAVDGDNAQPITSLMKKLDSFALEKVNQFVDPKIRAVALLKIIDGLLKTPVPTPRSLTHPKLIPCASLRVVPDPDTHRDAEGLSTSYEVTVHPGKSAFFLASGTIPSPLVSSSDIPFQVVLLWYTMTMKGEGPLSTPKVGTIRGGPVATSISSSGTFFLNVEVETLLNEGCYDFVVTLGCRDIRGGEWELPLENPHRSSVKVIQSTNSRTK